MTAIIHNYEAIAAAMDPKRKNDDPTGIVACVVSTEGVTIGRDAVQEVVERCLARSKIEVINDALRAISPPLIEAVAQDYKRYYAGRLVLPPATWRELSEEDKRRACAEANMRVAAILKVTPNS